MKTGQRMIVVSLRQKDLVLVIEKLVRNSMRWPVRWDRDQHSAWYD